MRATAIIFLIITTIIHTFVSALILSNVAHNNDGYIIAFRIGVLAIIFLVISQLLLYYNDPEDGKDSFWMDIWSVITFLSFMSMAINQATATFILWMDVAAIAGVIMSAIVWVIAMFILTRK